jgi:hypothetical protein
MGRWWSLLWEFWVEEWDAFGFFDRFFKFLESIPVLRYVLFLGLRSRSNLLKSLTKTSDLNCFGSFGFWRRDDPCCGSFEPKVDLLSGFHILFGSSFSQLPLSRSVSFFGLSKQEQSAEEFDLEDWHQWFCRDHFEGENWRAGRAGERERERERASGADRTPHIKRWRALWGCRNLWVMEVNSIWPQMATTRITM